jgi:hypothetical protein
MAQAMLHGKILATHLWGEAINIACYTINRVYHQPGMDMNCGREISRLYETLSCVSIVTRGY